MSRFGVLWLPRHDGHARGTEGLGCWVGCWWVRWFGVLWWSVGLGGWVAGRGWVVGRGGRTFRFCEEQKWKHDHTQKPKHEKYEDLNFFKKKNMKKSAHTKTKKMKKNNKTKKNKKVEKIKTRKNDKNGKINMLKKKIWRGTV